MKKNIHKQKHTHKKNKRLLADDLKKEKIREIDNEKKKNTTIKKSTHKYKTHKKSLIDK